MPTTEVTPSSTSRSPIAHPLEPLTVEEVAAAVSIVRRERHLGDRFRFPCVTLHEPSKSVVTDFQSGDAIVREAFLILLDNAIGATYEAVVSLTENQVISWKHIPGMQPNIMVVPYGDPRSQHFRKNAFDLGEHGIGMLANSLTLGCDCLGEIYYFDAVLTNSRGEVSVTKNAVCMHEEDYGHKRIVQLKIQMS